MDREQLKYGTEHTSVKVRQVPGGTSSISLGWNPDPPSKSKAQPKSTYSNYETRSKNQAYEDEYAPKPKAYGKSNNRFTNYDDEEDDYRNERRPNYDAEDYDEYSVGGASRSKYGRADDYDDGYGKSDVYSRGENSRTNDYKSDSYGRDPYAKNDPYARNPDPYARNPDPYARNTDSYARNADPYARNQDSYTRNNVPKAQESRGYDRSNQESYPRNDTYSKKSDPYSRGADSYTRNTENYSRDTGSSYKDTGSYGRDEGYGRNNEGNRRGFEQSYGDEYETRGSKGAVRRGYQDEDDYQDDSRRGNAKSKPKTSVKVQNPPGGQSSFIFG